LQQEPISQNDRDNFNEQGDEDDGKDVTDTTGNKNKDIFCIGDGIILNNVY